MANADVQTFIEDRIRALDPTVDLSPGSPTQTQLIQPLLTYLGTDPFETDIQTFILDRLAQEFPDVFAGDPGVVSDTLIKPLILLLEPFKRETQQIKNNQSLQDSTILSDADADALVANFFESRDSGGYATGVARLYFSNPINVTIQITTQFFTATGLNFYPTNPTATTAEEMVFNREGSLYFLDVALKAEQVGADYNIDKNVLTGVTGVYGVMKVTNLQKFDNGSTKIDTATFVAQAREALNERSMVTRRGATARLNEVFQTSVRAVQVIGAGDAEMQRDILVATSPGHAWLTGRVGIYKNIALVSCRTIDAGSETTAPVQGDTLYIYLDKYNVGHPALWTTLPQNERFIRLVVEEVLFGPEVAGSPYQLAYFVRFSDPDNLLALRGVSLLPYALSFEGGFAKKGTVTVASVPGATSTNLEVNNQEVHVLGHTDIYARPVLQNVSTAVIASLVDDPGSKYFSIQKQTLSSFGAVAGQENKLSDATIDFALAGVREGDVITIETGNDAGSYSILKVSSNTLYIGTKLTTSATALRYRIAKSLHVNPFAPKIPKVPFGSVPNNDLQTSIGSKQFVFNGTLTDLIAFNVKVGDVVRVSSGVDAGDFTITGIIDGKNILVDRVAGGSNSGLTYEVFTALESVQLPLVRLKSLLVLDSSEQTTGVEIPYAEPVAVVPTCDFTSAKVRGRSLRKSGFVLPQLNDGFIDFVTGGNVAAVSGDRRYSLGFDPVGALPEQYKAMLFQDATQAEFLFPGDASTDGCSYFLATSEDTSLPTNYPPVDPKEGDALTIKSGPNKGSYIIKSVRKFKYPIGSNSVWVYFIKIYGQFPVDIIRQLIKFCDDAGATVSKITNSAPGSTIAFPDFFIDTYQDPTTGLGAKLDQALVTYGVASPGQAVLQAAIDSVAQVDYEWGDPARGVLRSYFVQPTLFQQHTALSANPTLYSFKTTDGEVLRFRTNPTQYESYILVPPKLSDEVPMMEHPRDMVPTGTTVTFTDATRATMFQMGIVAGDSLSVHKETFFHGSTGSAGADTDRQTAVQTVAGSNIITAPSTSSGPVFSVDMVGKMLFIDEGPEEGTYLISGFVDPYSLQISSPMSQSTPTIINEGNSAEWGWDGVNNKIVAAAPGAFNVGMIGKWVTLYGIDSRYQGSYAIAGVPNNQTLNVTRPLPIGAFPAYPVAPGAIARWVVTDAPLTAPSNNAALKGTELTGLRPIRIYNDVATEYPISAVPTDLSASVVTVASAPPLGIKQPFHITRPNIRRVTPNEMSLNVEGPMYYFDTEAVSLGPQSSNNIGKTGSYLTVDEGTYESVGYRHIVDDNNLTYSTKESGVLDIPLRILPVNNEDSLDNMLSLSGVPIQVSYEYGDVIQQIQDFISSPEDRVTSANMLARHFLPSYVSYDATYVGGSAPSVIAADIISYIDTLAIETPIDVSVMEDLITKRGGNPITPTKVVLNIHDWDRKMWAEFSENEIGGTITSVPYNGTPRVSYFVPGPDASGQTGISGERITLTKK